MNSAPTRKPNRILIAALLILVLAGVARFILAANFGYEYDVREYKRFALKIQREGASELYVPDRLADMHCPSLFTLAAGGFGFSTDRLVSDILPIPHEK